MLLLPGYNYGCDRVPMSEEDKVGMKFQSEKSFKMIGFTKAEHVSVGGSALLCIHHIGWCF